MILKNSLPGLGLRRARMFQGLRQDHINGILFSEAWALPLCHVLGGRGRRACKVGWVGTLLPYSEPAEQVRAWTRALEFLLESWLCAFSV